MLYVFTMGNVKVVYVYMYKCVYVVCVFVDDCPLVLGSSRAAVLGI